MRPPQADTVEGPPVDRDGDSWLEKRQRLSRPLGVQVAGSEGGAPAAYRQQRNVELSTKLTHFREYVRITGEVDALRTGDREADRLGAPIEEPPTTVLGGSGGDCGPVDDVGFAHPQLYYAFETEACCRLERTSRNDQVATTIDQSKRNRVEVIVVQMRDEHGIDIGNRVWVDRGARTHEVRDTAPKNRIGEEPTPV